MARRFKMAVLDVVKRRKMGLQSRKHTEKLTKPTKRNRNQTGNSERTGTHSSPKPTVTISGSKSYQITGNANYLSPHSSTHALGNRKYKNLDRQKSLSSPNLNAFESTSNQK